MKNTKGLSTIVTTLILVLLALVAVGILWNPVKNLLNESNEAFDNTKCLTVDITPSVTHVAASPDYDVKITRKDGGDEPVGIKLVFLDDVAGLSSGVYTMADSWDALVTYQETISPETSGSVPITDATEVQITPFFVDIESSKEQLCTTINFALG